MSGSSPVPGLNAHRHPQDPLRPPAYLLQNVTKCQRDLTGSVIQEIKDRDQFKEAMAEMVMLCTEAMRRTSASRCASKPLSLEYIADRLDVDDPCFGYIVRSKEGMLQGFITVTTFTNWQKSFRWDSLHELAFYYDESDSEDEDECRHQPKKDRIVDRNGELAHELQQTVRLGDPYNEGIVWPRIAEISLLGGLGCGRALVRLVIEQLEFQKSSSNANYDYIVLQATDNSITFYESLGFVRVGAVTTEQDDRDQQPYEKRQQKQHRRRSASKQNLKTQQSPSTTHNDNASVNASADTVPQELSSPDNLDTLSLPSDIVSSPLTSHKVAKGGETPLDISKKWGVDVWDVIFLNKDMYPEITPRSRLRKDTVLHIPAKPEKLQKSKSDSPTKWFVAKENDTPRKIAKKFGIPCKKLVEANLNRMPDLMSGSRLKQGTRVKVSNLDQLDDVCNPYCHWSFPDDASVDAGEPSYMMVYKLDKKSSRCKRDTQNSLAVPVSRYSPPQLLLPAPKPSKVPIKLPDRPKAPPEPDSAMDIFKNHQRDLFPQLRDQTAENDAILHEKWVGIGKEKQERYESIASQTRGHFQGTYEQYEVELSLWEDECARLKSSSEETTKEVSLFSKVVKLRDDALEGKDYKYWFVLTYIPDLKWCHLAPMYQDGVFGSERKRSNGRPKWRLVDEDLGKEIDVSSMFCIPVKSKALKKTADADKEEWDILDDAGSGKGGILKSKQVPMGEPVINQRRCVRKQPLRRKTVAKTTQGKSNENANFSTAEPTKNPPPVAKAVSPNDEATSVVDRYPETEKERHKSPAGRGAPLWSSPSSSSNSENINKNKRKRGETPPKVSPRSSPGRSGSTTEDEESDDIDAKLSSSKYVKARKVSKSSSSNNKNGTNSNNDGARRVILQS